MKVPTPKVPILKSRTSQRIALLSLLAAVLLLFTACQSTGYAPQAERSTELHDPFREGELREFTLDGEVYQYEVLDGLAIFEGDMILGDAAEFEQLTAQGVTRDDPNCNWFFCRDFRWSGGVVPFVINGNLSTTMRNRINSAIAHWESRTQINFVAKQWYHGDYVEFRAGSGCSAHVGRIGGRQFVNLSNSCSTGSIIHEIGHAVGMWHEHTRCDRNSFVRIRWDRIPDNRENNFFRHCSDGTDRGAYDFGSIMHYGPTAFSSNGLPTIECRLASCPAFGQRSGLSFRDRQTVNGWY